MVTPRQKAAPLSGALLARDKTAQQSGLVLSDGGPITPDPVAVSQAATQSAEAMKRQPDSRFDDLTRRLGDPETGPDWRNPFRAILLFAIPLAAFSAVFWYVYSQTADTANDTAATTGQQPVQPAASTSPVLSMPAPAAGPVTGEKSPAPTGTDGTQAATAPPAPKAVVPPPTPPAATSEPKPALASTPATTPSVMPPVPARDKPAAPIRTAKAPAASAGADKAASQSGGRYTIQLSSVRSAKGARREWARLQRSYPGLLKGLDLDVRQVTLRQRGTYHRVRAGAFDNRTTARALCAKLKSRKQACLVVRR